MVADQHLDRVFRELTDRNVLWCLLRGDEKASLIAGDVDLLIAASDAKHAEQALLEAGFLPTPDWNVSSHRHFTTYDAVYGKWLVIDVVFELSYGPRFEIQTGAARGVLSRREWHTGVPVPCREDAFWTLLWHCLLDKESIAPEHGERLQQLVPDATESSRLAHGFDQLLPVNWQLCDVLARVECGDFHALAPLSQELRARAQQSTSPRLLTAVRSTFRRVLFRWSRPGVSVALLGPDGAGKTTLSDGLKEAFIFPVRTIAMSQIIDPGGPSALMGFELPGSVLLRLLIRLWSTSLRGSINRALGRLLVYDRFTYDRFFVLESDISVKERIYFSIITRAIPHPDIVVILNVPAETMYARKGEHDPEALEVQRQRYLRMPDRLANAVVVDATQDQDTVLKNVTQLIWHRYVSKWGGRGVVKVRPDSRSAAAH